MLRLRVANQVAVEEDVSCHHWQLFTGQRPGLVDLFLTLWAEKLRLLWVHLRTGCRSLNEWQIREGLRRDIGHPRRIVNRWIVRKRFLLVVVCATHYRLRVVVFERISQVM